MTDQPLNNASHQESRVVQTNQQTLHVHIHNLPRASDLTGQIAGAALRDEGTALAHCEVQLYFGPIGEYPVATTRTDASGGFAFDDLPPGFYGLRLCLAYGQVVHLHNLRLLPGETCRPRLLLSGTASANRFHTILGAIGEDPTVRSLQIDNPT